MPLMLLKLFASPKVWLALALAIALAFTHGAAFRSGKAIGGTAAAQAAEARAKGDLRVFEQFQAKRAANEKEIASVDAKYQATKAARAADARDNAYLVQRITRAIDIAHPGASEPAEPATASGTDDPYPGIARQCVGAFAGVVQAYRELRDKAGALQEVAPKLCVTTP